MSPPTDEPFSFGGRLSLDLTWTLRYRAVRPTELLATPGDLCRWLETVGLPAPRRAGDADLVAAIALREAIYRAAAAVIDGQPIRSSDRIAVNEPAALAPPAPLLGTDGTRRLVAPAGREVTSSLSAVARDAVELLSAGDGRLRRCAGPQCSLLFHDGSRPGSRRWCDTARCGNRVNTMAYRQRRRDPDA